MTKAFIIMWLLVGPHSGFTSDNLSDGLKETQSDCLETAHYLNTHGFSGQRCVAVKVTLQ